MASEGPRGGVGDSVPRQLPLRLEGLVAACFRTGEGMCQAATGDDLVVRHLDVRKRRCQRIASEPLLDVLTLSLIEAKLLYHPSTYRVATT